MYKQVFLEHEIVLQAKAPWSSEQAPKLPCSFGRNLHYAAVAL